MQKKQFFLLSSTVIFLVALLYHPVIHAGYVWDDVLLFVDKVSLLNDPLSWDLLSKPVLDKTSYFRPLVFFTIYLEFHLLGQIPLISHLVNVFFLIANTMLVGLIASRLLFKLARRQNFIAILFSCIFYVAHPALIETTAWISGRFDILVTFFSLLGCYLFIKWQAGNVRDILIGLCFLLALLSKELGIVFPFLLFCIAMLLADNTVGYKNNILSFLKKDYRLLLILFLVVVVYFILRIDAMHKVYHQSLDWNYIKEIYLKEKLPIHALFFYIKQTFIPFFGIAPLHPIEALDNAWMKVLFNIGLTIMLIVFLANKIRYIWLILAGLSTVSLVIYIIPITIANNIAHERFMTLGLAFIAIFFAILPYEKISKSIKKIVIFFSVIWLCFAIITSKTIVPLWNSNLSLWTWAYKQHPDNKLAKNSFLIASYAEKKFDNIIKVMKEDEKSGDGIDAADQIIYMNTLFSLNNIEALKYADGLYSVLPKFHENAQDKNSYFFELSNIQIAGFYNSYALIIYFFTRDVDRALHFAKISEWYFDDDQKHSLQAFEVFLLYERGDYEAAKKLQNTVDKTKSFYNPWINNFSLIYTACMKIDKSSEQLCKDKMTAFKNFLETDYEK